MKNCSRCRAGMDGDEVACPQCGHLNRRLPSELSPLDAFLNRLKEKASDPARSTLMRERCQASGDGILENPVRLPANLDDFQVAEKKLGVRLPGIVRIVYAAVGNGGFGPGFGLFSLEEFVDEYETCREPVGPGWDWPSGLLPICHWGCGTYSYLNCTQRDPSIYRFFYEGYDPEDPSTYFHAISAAVFSQEAPSFQLWLEWWLDGTLRSK